MDAIRIKTYDGLRKFARGFADGKFRLLIILGRAGIGKSSVVKAAMGNRGLWVSSATPFGIYGAIADKPSEPVILDDVDAALRTRSVVQILKQVCDTRPIRTITWLSQKTMGNSLPQSVTFTAPVAILLNDLPAKPSEDLKAIFSRALIVRFEPSNEEVHSWAGTWFNPTHDVYRWTGQNLALLGDKLSGRWYAKAKSLADAGLEPLCLLEQYGVERKTILAAILYRGPDSLERKIELWVARGHGTEDEFLHELDVLHGYATAA